ncbi:MAG: hypothetical protein QOE48_4284 [Mycobacterium sp.]|jgi:hypothetical protein|nr:hypothetical protein [Mycobacterium sp.]
MRKYYFHTLLYLHETIALGSGSSERFTEEFNGTYQPMMQARRRGAAASLSEARGDP